MGDEPEWEQYNGEDNSRRLGRKNTCELENSNQGKSDRAYAQKHDAEVHKVKDNHSPALLNAGSYVFFYMRVARR